MGARHGAGLRGAVGHLQGLGVKARNYVYRSDYSRGRDSNRIYLTYDIAIW
ncbi:OprD family porin [Pseudomonas bharatica]|uniref:OprD family porin n=1 Tax=Pseudomonas bharatica TaxID=2692112 RepID=UPI001F03426C